MYNDNNNSVYIIGRLSDCVWSERRGRDDNDEEVEVSAG